MHNIGMPPSDKTVKSWKECKILKIFYQDF